MEKYNGFRLLEPDLEARDMQKEVIDKLQNTQEALAVLESQTVTGHIKSWLAVSLLLRSNPHSYLLRILISKYVLALQSIEPQDFREFWVEIYDRLTREDLKMWRVPVSDEVSCYRSYHLLGTMADLKARLLEMEVIDSLDALGVKEAVKMIEKESGIEYDQKWYMISGLVFRNPSCTKLKSLRRTYIESQSSPCSSDFKKLCAQIKDDLTEEEYEMCVRTDISLCFEWFALKLCPVWNACFTFTLATRYLDSDSDERSLQLLTSSAVFIGINLMFYLVRKLVRKIASYRPNN